MSAIEQYLKDFQKTIPAHLRREAVAEVHSHLEELTRDWQRRGLSRLEAESKAVSEFGAPWHIGNQWRRAAGVVDWPDILLAALPILDITGLGWEFVGKMIPWPCIWSFSGWARW